MLAQDDVKTQSSVLLGLLEILVNFFPYNFILVASNKK